MSKEETLEFLVDFSEGKLVPTIVQNVEGEVLYLSSTNQEAFDKMRETKTVWRYSKTNDRLLQVGSASGKIEYVEEIYVNCFQNTLLLRVKQEKDFACHTGMHSCFYRRLKQDDSLEMTQKQIVNPEEIY
jgi:phosphoribosyl-AMP cyclohydrolase